MLLFISDIFAEESDHLAMRSGHTVTSKDWIELFIRNEKILSPDSEISRNFHNFLQFFCNSQRILTFSHTSVKFREIFIKLKLMMFFRSFTDVCENVKPF